MRGLDMAKTSAERQAAYRLKRAGQHSDERRINTWVSRAIYLKLEELAGRYGVTKRAVIELLVSHENGALKELSAKALSAKSGAAVEAGVVTLRRNSLRAVDGGGAKPKRIPAEKLRRNDKPVVDRKKVGEQLVHVEAPKRSQSNDDQYGFEF
jgi:hypothetical protein